MARRFIDSELYKNPWFRRLSPTYKCVFVYTLCACNHAGILKLDLEDIDFHVKPDKPITMQELKTVFENKWLFLKESEDGQSAVIFIPRFIYWQYKNALTPTNKVHRSVITLLLESGITGIKGYLRDDVDPSKPLECPTKDPPKDLTRP